MRPYLNEYFLAARVEPADMDRLWAEGWRHFGAYFFRYSQAGSQTVLPLRVHLAQFALSRSQQRVLRKNQDIQVKLQPAFVNAQVEALFARHKTRFSHSIPKSIYTFISRHPAHIPCRCHSLTLHHQGRLVGISYLDEGAQATSSVYQCFDPDLSRRSLGILMILHSILLSRAWGKAYYYPGYAYLEPSEYDYKKRLGALEYFDWQGNWLKFEDNPALTPPSPGLALE
ncbi:GNAT family N-acetyltransferase [Meiothermus taiwanensis]|uniref:Putative arginyl-tRNA--protein transferase n=1 Tax=Meiothermus taiwanensis TaxID=172827 RepID=A0A399DTA4_9DEIN|nr:GNAT family N-acetyltransferase [Meiothermus taiwanensis]KIQ54696.1 arginine-tRNA-protein transferase [Meiothermus taiwanensis]KZK16319.1 arginine-tRNA-protein transferase [Meiothermus taiwanensis]RIH75484.1 putative arginyl-tRNA--protein transferase [Meiothermus taiwanensis]